MKILQFIYQLGNGGAEKFCVELSNEQAQHHEVILCSAKKIEDWMIPPKNLSPKVKLIELNLKKYSTKGFYEIFKILKNEKPDIVHIHSSLLFFHLSFLIVLFRRIKFIHTIHNTVTSGYKKLFDLLLKIRFLHKNLHHVCISPDIQRKYQKRYPKMPFYHIDNGISPMQITEQLPMVKKEVLKIKGKNKYLFIAIGNYSIFKNFIMLVKVIKKLNLEGFKISLIILGEDKSKNKEQWNLVKDNKDNHTYQLGLKDNVSDYLYCSDALIMSSTKEGMPLVVLEAMSMKKPIISTPAGGMVDIIKDGSNGLIAKGFKTEDLYQEMVSFLKMDPYLIKKMQIECKKIYQKQYSMDQCGRGYQNLYEGNF